MAVLDRFNIKVDSNKIYSSSGNYQTIRQIYTNNGTLFPVNNLDNYIHPTLNSMGSDANAYRQLYSEITNKFVNTDEGINFDLEDTLADAMPSIITNRLYKYSSIPNISAQTLPSTYQQVEYIQSTGTQWINTGYSRQPLNEKVEIQYTMLDSTKNQMIAGTIGVVTNYEWWYSSQYNNDTFSIFTYNNGQSSVVCYAPRNTSLHTVIADGNTIICDGINKGNVNFPSSFGGNFSLLGGQYNGNYNAEAKLYGCNISSNGVLVRNYIPCYRKSDNTIGLYDLVTNTFLVNSGTGVFGKGNDIPPQGLYQEVEYIQSSGTQYINTGIIANQDTSIECKAHTYTGTSTYGGTPAYLNVTASSVYLGSYFYWNGYNSGSIGSVVNECITIFKQTKNVCYRNWTNVGSFTYTTWSDNVPVFLFGRNNAGVLNDAGTTRIYYCKIWNNGVLVRDFIPCYRVTDNVIGMYDKVSNAFYINAGTGVFTKGTNSPTNYPIMSAYMTSILDKYAVNLSGTLTSIAAGTYTVNKYGGISSSIPNSGILMLQGGGGGSGGTNQAGADAAGGGGGSGGFAIIYYRIKNISTNISITFEVGAGGSAGGSGSGDGGTGGATRVKFITPSGEYSTNAEGGNGGQTGDRNYNSGGSGGNATYNLGVIAYGGRGGSEGLTPLSGGLTQNTLIYNNDYICVYILAAQGGSGGGAGDDTGGSTQGQSGANTNSISYNLPVTNFNTITSRSISGHNGGSRGDSVSNATAGGGGASMFADGGQGGTSGTYTNGHPGSLGSGSGGSRVHDNQNHPGTAGSSGVIYLLT